MAIPFASGYAPINLLNNAIQAQDQARRQGSLAWQQMNEQSISDALNRAVQQKALEQQAAAQQQHYGLQQQQLANDLAYRNQALGLTGQQQAEAKRQFDAKLALDKAIADANIRQMDRPGFGMGKDTIPLLIQTKQEADLANQEADSAESELNRKKSVLDAYHKTESERINKQWFSKSDLKALDDKYQADVLALKVGVKGAERTRFNPSSGKFEALHVNPPSIPGQQPQGLGTSEAPVTPQGAPEAPGQGTGENQPMAGIQPQAAPAFNAFGIPTSINPFKWFNSAPANVQTNAPPVMVNPPVQVATPNGGIRFYNVNPDGTLGTTTVPPGFR